MERQPAAGQEDRPATPGIWRSPGGLCILKADRSHTREVVPGALFMKHMFSRDFSIAYYEVPAGAGNKAPVRAHSHGEEVAIVLSGSGNFETAAGERCAIGAGDVLVIPADVEHWGSFSNDETMRLVSIVTPPRTQLGPEGGVPFFPLGETAMPAESRGGHDPSASQPGN
ncbi:cupin domain-containing protein [Immundisolibacter sp.]